MMVLYSAWVLTWAGSFASFIVVEPAGSGFTRGLNQLTTFLGWQGVAAMISFAVLGAGRSWPPRHPIRRASLLPIGLALGLAAVIVAMVAYASFAG